MQSELFVSKKTNRVMRDEIYRELLQNKILSFYMQVVQFIYIFLQKKNTI